MGTPSEYRRKALVNIRHLKIMLRAFKKINRDEPEETDPCKGRLRVKLTIGLDTSQHQEFHVIHLDPKEMTIVVWDKDAGEDNLAVVHLGEVTKISCVDTPVGHLLATQYSAEGPPEEELPPSEASEE